LSERAVNIVGVGGTLMGDDGVGPAVIERLRRRTLPANLRLYDAGLAFSDVIGTLDPCDPLIVIDAVETSGAPGALLNFRLDDVPPGTAPLSSCLSLHEIAVRQSLEIEALTGRVFSDVTVFGTVPQTISWGAPLSPPVAAAVDELADAVLEYVREISARPSVRPAFAEENLEI